MSKTFWFHGQKSISKQSVKVNDDARREWFAIDYLDGMQSTSWANTLSRKVMISSKKMLAFKSLFPNSCTGPFYLRGPFSEPLCRCLLADQRQTWDKTYSSEGRDGCVQVAWLHRVWDGQFYSYTSLSSRCTLLNLSKNITSCHYFLRSFHRLLVGY